MPLLLFFNSADVVAAARSILDSLKAFLSNHPLLGCSLSVGGLFLGAYARHQWSTRHIRAALGKLPTPPGSVPYFGHALALLRTCPWDEMGAWSCAFDNQPIRIEFMGERGILISDPEFVKWVFDKKERNYGKDIEFAYKSFMPLIGNGLIVSQGQLWKNQRSLLSSAFRIEILDETMDVAKRAVDRLSIKLERYRGMKETIEMGEEFRVLTLQVIAELVLSLSPQEAEEIFPHLYLPIVTEANLRVWYPWRSVLPSISNLRYHQTLHKLNVYVETIIKTRYNQRINGKIQHKQDILDRVLEAVPQENWNNQTIAQLRDEIKTFIFAGHETSAAMLTWSLYESSLDQNIRDKIIAEGHKTFSSLSLSSSLLPIKDKIIGMEYTVCVLKEALRKYSVVPVVSRTALEDDEFNNIVIPKNTKIFVNIKSIHHNPKLWSQPEIFIPERFLQPFDSYNFLAFIQGPRHCLGQYLALLESRIVLSLLIQAFKFIPRDADIGIPHPSVVPVTSRDGMHMFIE